MFRYNGSSAYAHAGQARKSSIERKGIEWLMIIIVLIFIGFLFGSRSPAESPEDTTKSVNKGTVYVKGGLDRKCTEEERDWQSRIAPAARARGCSPKDFAAMRLVHAHLSGSTTWNFIDVGSNKGYAASEWYELFMPQLGVSRKALKSTYNDAAFPAHLKGNATYATECGGCNECYDESSPLLLTRTARACTAKASQSTSSRKQAKDLENAVDILCDHMNRKALKILRVWSFEANPPLVEALTEAITRTSSSIQTLATPNMIPTHRFMDRAAFDLSKHWTVENFVLTSKEHADKKIKVSLNEGELGRIELVPYPATRVDDERSATFWVKTSKDAEMTPVNSITLDTIIRERLKGEPADMVKIDAEGHDFDVIMGAKESLEAHKIKTLKFEYGTLWTRRLQEVITFFDQIDYACYFEGKNGMLKLTGKCWSEALETRFWSNVWCFSQHHREGVAMASAFDAMTIAFW